MERNTKADILKILKSLNIETKANEANSTGQSGYGADFVPTDVSTEIIRRARAETSLFSLMPSGNVINMPTNPYKIPVEGADPVFYHTSEEPNVPGTAVPTSKVGTGGKTLTAKKFSASVYLSGELDEDARVAGGMQGYITDKLGKAYAELLDKTMINGDIVTGATGNVNSDDAAPAAGSYYLAMDGLIKKAIAAGATVNGGTLDAGDVITTRAKLGRLGARPNDLLIIMNLETYYKILTLAQVETAEKFSGATIENGELTKIYGMAVYVAPDLVLADADGKVNTGAGVAANTLGRFLVVHLPSLVFGWRRKMKITVKYLDETDQYRLTAHTRFAFDVATPTNATNAVSLAYNITV